MTIYEAAERGDITEVERLLQTDPTLLDRPGSGGWTPLHWAAAGGHVEVVNLLLAQGADDTLYDNQGHSAMYWAGHYHDRAEVTLILMRRWGEKVKRENAQKETVCAVHAAIRSSDMAALNLYLTADPTLVNCREHTDTPLMAAVDTKNLAIVEYLLQFGVNLNAIDADGKTAIDRAQANGSRAILERLTALQE